MLDVLVADDDANVLESISLALIRAGHHVTEATDGGQAMELLSTHVFDLAICDVQMPKLDGMTVMRRIRREAPTTSVVLMTTYGRIDDVVESLRDGAVDYVTKPFDPDDFARDVVATIDAHRSHMKNAETARAQMRASSEVPLIVAVSPRMRALVDRMSLLASSDTPVLVTGEPGTGKELVARTLHAEGSRRDAPFMLLSRDVLATMLARDWVELHERARGRETWLGEALGGTVVLDGIEDLTVAAQAHLLRIVAEPRSLAGCGADGRPFGLRFITLTQGRLPSQVLAGDFLGSLYHRLAGAQLHVPTLAEREEDLLPLVVQLLRELASGSETVPSVSRGAWTVLSGHRFDGNVRELRGALQYALARCKGGPIGIEHLPVQLLA